VPAPKSQKRVSQSTAPKSLNIAVRKKENERIERENHAFAKRLFDRQGVISKKNMDDQFTSHCKYKKQVQKVKKRKMPNYGGRSNLLPPIEQQSADGNLKAMAST
jgi:hypothetical protein